MTPAPEKAAPIPAKSFTDRAYKIICEAVGPRQDEWSVFDRAVMNLARDADEALAQDRADREARPSLPDSREKQISPTGDLVRLYYEYDRIPDWFTDKRRAAHKEFREAMSAAIDEAGLRARQGGNNG